MNVATKMYQKGEEKSVFVMSMNALHVSYISDFFTDLIFGKYALFGLSCYLTLSHYHKIVCLIISSTQLFMCIPLCGHIFCIQLCDIQLQSICQYHYWPRIRFELKIYYLHMLNILYCLSLLL